jgi:hypothetical protein
VNLRRRYGNGFAFINDYLFDTSYTLSRSNDQGNQLLAFLSGVSNPTDLELDRGPASFDARHRFTFSGVFDLKQDIIVSSSIILRTAQPFEIIQNHDFSGGRLPVIIVCQSSLEMPVTGKYATGPIRTEPLTLLTPILLSFWLTVVQLDTLILV